MALQISGPGVGLPGPQNLYPSELGALLAPYDYGNNLVGLAPGQTLPLPNGTFYIGLGRVSILQFLDPVSGVWRMHPWTTAARQGIIQIPGDGFTYRVANLTGCPVSAVVTNSGNGYPANTVVTSGGTGGSTWQPIIGGGVSISSITNAGSGYGVPPMVFIPAPPTPGIQATADALIQSGTVASITMRNWGGGYTTAPAITILPNPTDPNLLAGNTMVNARALATLQGSGSIMGILCTNPGQSVSSAPALTITGTGGANGAATALLMQTMTGSSVVAGGASIASGVFFAFGAGAGATPATQFPNPQLDLSTWIPRQGSGTLFASGGSIVSISTITDGGLFVGAAATVAVLPTGGLTAGANAQPGSITSVMGATFDTVWIQPAGGV